MLQALEDRIGKMQDPSDKSHGLHIRDHANVRYAEDNLKTLLQIYTLSYFPINLTIYHKILLGTT